MSNEGDLSRKPLDTAIRQQRMKAWKPILDPWYVIGAFILIGFIFIPTGIVLKVKSDDLVELKETYDGYDLSDTDRVNCGIAGPNENKECEIKFTAPKDLEPPIFIHYELTNFYQNHRVYVSSRCPSQLLGKLDLTAKEKQDCEPLAKLGDITINPCGLIANTLFNDVFTLNTNNSNAEFKVNEQGIAWKSDIEYKYAQPEGFKSEQCSSCDACSCDDSNQWSCKEPYLDEDGNCHRYYYPDDDTTQYLYETYPMVVSPIEGVLNEHFIVWMRVAALPTFRKLYGWIDTKIPKDTELIFNVNANYDVMSFKGSKSLIVSTTGSFGGKNDFLPMAYILVGTITLILGILFGLKQWFYPRKLADRSYLKFKLE